MSFVSAAALITYGTVAAAGVGYLAASKGASAAKDAANTAAGAQNNAAQVANDQFNKQIELQQPFYDVGKEAIPKLNAFNAAGYSPQGLDSPTAKYELQTGTKALNRALASRGLSGSGNAANRIAELGMGVAARDEQRSYGRWQDQYQKILDSLKLGTGASASMGNASATLTNAAQSGANSLGNIAMQNGNTQASLYAGIPGATANMAATGLNAYNAYNRYNTPANTTPTGVDTNALQDFNSPYQLTG
jgi:hypothetical protein